MSKVFNMVGGGGGPAASIFVTGLSETDTVYATKDGKTVHGKWDSERSGFLISPLREFAMWTVTAKVGNLTHIKEILIDVVTEFELDVMSVNYTMLYDAGDECSEITGGWNVSGGSKYDTYIQGATSNYESKGAYAKNAIDLSDYKYIGGMWDCYASVHANKYSGAIWIASSSGFMGNQIFEVQTFYGVKNNVIDLGDLVEHGVTNAYISLFCYYCSTRFREIFIVKEDPWERWLESGGLSAASYDSIDAVFADSDALTKLLNTSEAVSVMLGSCTGSLMAKTICNANMLSAIANSAYREQIYANEHWAKFLAMVQ